MIPDRLNPQWTNPQLRESVLSSGVGRRGRETHASAVLEVVEEDMETLALDTIVLDDNTGASDDFPGVALTVDLAETSPGAEDFCVADLDEVDLVLCAQGLDELDVLCLCAGLDEDAEVGLALVEGLGTLAEPAGEAVVHEGVFQNLLCGSGEKWEKEIKSVETDLKGFLDGKLSLGCGFGGDVDLGGGGVNGNVISSVGHPGQRR